MRGRLSLAAATLLLAMALPAGADIVVLRSGGSLEGIVTQAGDEVTVELTLGRVTVPRRDVAQVIPSRTPLREFRQREAALRSGDAQALFELGVWAEQADLPVQAKKAFQHALVIDPDHAGARARLGFERGADGRWLSEDDSRRARGFVKYEGEWVSKEEAGLRQALAQQKSLEARARAEEARAEAERKAAERAEAIAEARMRALESQYAAIAYQEELRRSRRFSDPYGSGFGFPFFLTPTVVSSGSVTSNFVRDGNGAFVTVTTNNLGQQTWVRHPGGGAADLQLHADGDGHCVQHTQVNGQLVQSHFSNATCTGAPDITIRSTSAQHP
ncbi:MAG: hypothetical protein HYZ53_09220 [Planctomycetes bacterium]|nr:hypothetical protein [Planctomycetota bacterium]